MSDHVHTCAICDGYWTCENACSYLENAECYDCLRKHCDNLQRGFDDPDGGPLARALATSQYHLEQQRRRKAEDQLEGQGIGLTALAMLLGHPEDGLIEAVKRLVAERDKYRQLHDMEVVARKVTRDAMATEAARLIAEVDRLRGLLREALDLADEAIGYTPEYFQDKRELPQTAARLRRALGGEVE